MPEQTSADIQTIETMPAPAARRKWGALLLKAALVVIVTILCLICIYALPFTRPVSTLMIKNTVLMNEVDRRWVSIDDMSSHLVNSVMIAEDGQFCSHDGIDWHQLELVLSGIGEGGGAARGASTITMQTAKNLFLWNGRSYLRKGLELPLAMAIDLIMPKKRIMEIYLNIAEWGPGIYGAEAAAQHYFKRSASKLTASQSALLAATLPNPAMRNPARPSAGMQRIARIFQTRAQRAGPYVTCLK